MSCVPETDAAHLPATYHFAENPRRTEERFSRPEGKFIDGIDRDVVAHVENARPFVAAKTIHVLGSVGFSASDRAIVDGMRPRITRLERQPATEAALQRQPERMVTARSDVMLEVDRAKRIGIVRVRIVLVEGPDTIAVSRIKRNGSGTE